MENVEYAVIEPKQYTANELSKMGHTEMMEKLEIQESEASKIRSARSLCGELFKLDAVHPDYDVITVVPAGEKRHFFLAGERISCQYFYNLERNGYLEQI